MPLAIGSSLSERNSNQIIDIVTGWCARWTARMQQPKGSATHYRNANPKNHFDVVLSLTVFSNGSEIIYCIALRRGSHSRGLICSATPSVIRREVSYMSPQRSL